MAEQSITITFVSEVTAVGESLVVDLDTEMNEDETQFLYGTKAYFRVFKNPSSMSVALTNSDGTLAAEGSGVATIEDDYVIFANTDSGSVSYPISSIVSYEWLGASLGSVSIDGSGIKSSISGIGVLKLSYTSNFSRHSITIAEKESDEYPVIVFALGTA